MSQSSSLSNNTDTILILSTVTAEERRTNVCEADRTPKRGASEQVDDHIKKVKVERESSEKDVSNFVPKFMTASQILAHQPRTTIEVLPEIEISDEELLAMTIEFEKKHPEYN